MLRACLLTIAAFLFVLTGRVAQAEVRVALVIGNSAYNHTAPLANAVNDARDMTAALRKSGFEVVEVVDADKRRFDLTFRDFADKLARADVALFYYAGHGLQIGDQNWLVPTDAKLERERDLEFEAVKLAFVLNQFEIDRRNKISIFILDACRDNPLSRNLARSMGSRSAQVGRGLAAASGGVGTFFAYATQPGNVALDALAGGARNSPFTAALVRHMDSRGRNLPATMVAVRRDVVAATNGQQVPWDHSSMMQDFYFTPDTGQRAPAIVLTPPADPAPAPAQAKVVRPNSTSQQPPAASRYAPGWENEYTACMQRARDKCGWSAIGIDLDCLLVESGKCSGY